MTIPKGWERLPIQDLYLGLYDGPHATPPAAEAGPVFLGIGNITDDGHLDLGNVRHIAEEDFPRWTKRVTPQAGDIVFTYEATLNRYAIVPSGFRGCLGRRLALIRPNTNEVDTRFLHYYFFSQDWRETIEGNKLAGATVDRIPLTHFPKFPVNVPPLTVQRRIASILSTYDDLIENNIRRAEILEEMALRLYEEWFVRFRFPGHDNSPVDDGLPQGWSMTTLGEAAVNFDRLRKPLSKMQRAERQGPYPYYGAAKVFDYIDDYIFDGRYLLLAEDGSVMTKEGYPVLQLVSGKFWPNNHTHVLQGAGHFSTEFLYLALKRYPIAGHVTGAAQPKITQANMNRITIPAATEDVHRDFDTMIRPVFRMLENLDRKNANLCAQRDLLLPKLISGQIDVSQAEEMADEDAA